MLPKFIKRGYVGTEFFFDFDRGGWVQMGDEWKRQEIEDTTDIMIELANNLPEGVTAIIMDSHDKVVDVHNAIAEAVGEAHMNITATEIDERMAQLTLPSLDLTEQLDALSGIIEKALNETGYVKEPPSPTHMKRRF